MFEGHITAGIPVSLTGQFSAQGKQALRGLEAWSNWINRKGGIWVAERGRKLLVRVCHYDDRSLSASTRDITRHLLLEDEVDLLFGPYASSLALASAEVVSSQGGLLWNQGGAIDTIHQRGYRWIVSILSSASTYLQGLPHLVKESDRSASRLALVYASAGGFSRTVAEGMEREAIDLGFDTVLKREFPVTTSDFSQIIDSVDKICPDLFLGVGRIYNDLLLARQMSQRNLNIGAVAFVGTPIREFRYTLGQNREGILGPSQWEFLDSSVLPEYGPTPREVVNILGSQADQLDYPEVQSFAAGLIAQRSIEESGSLSSQSLWEAAVGLDYSTFYGRFKIDPKTGQQIGHRSVIVQWQRGEKTVVWPVEIRQSRLLFPWSDYRLNVG